MLVRSNSRLYVIEVFIKSWFLYIFYGKGLTNYYIAAAAAAADKEKQNYGGC